MSSAEPSSKEDANDKDTVEVKAVHQIQTLNENYEKLFQVERSILAELHQLQQDELKLREALDLAKENRRDKMKREQQEKNDDVYKKMAKTLLTDDDSSSSDEDEDGVGNDVDFGFLGMDEVLFKQENSSSDDDNKVQGVAL